MLVSLCGARVSEKWRVMQGKVLIALVIVLLSRWIDGIIATLWGGLS